MVLLALYSLLIESCRLCPFETRIYGLEEPVCSQFIDTTYIMTDTVYSNSFRLYTQTKSIIGGCVTPEHLNMLVASSFKLTCDKDFVYDNTSITAGTDYGQIDDLEVWIRPSYEYEEGSIRITFTQAFMNKAQFQNTDYTFKIEIETDDGEELMVEKTVIMDL